MRLLLLLLTLAFALPALAGQRVWLNASEDFYDPADPNDRQVYYITLPLEKAADGEKYTVAMYHANGALAMEGFAPDPEWTNRALIGAFQTYYDDGSPGASGRYKPQQQDCGCGHRHSVQDGRFAAYYQNGQVQYDRTYVDGVLQDGDYQEFDEQGRVTREYTYRNGGYDGVVKEYEQGRLVQETHYQDGQREGLLVRYEAGEPVFRKMYRNNKANGEEVSLKDGRKRRVYQYVDGLKRGVQKEYHANGVLKEIWVAGERSLPVGEHAFYNEQGVRTRLIDTKRNERGDELAETDLQYDDQGRLTYRRVERDDYRLTEKYDEAGELVERSERDENGRQGLYLRDGYGHIRAHYVDSELHGAYREMSSNGATTEGHYVHDRKNGLWVDERADGSRVETHYRMGVKHGAYAVYDADGKRVQHANYVDGELDGNVDIVSGYGRRVVAGFRQGERHGDFRAYTDDGRLIEKGHYVNGEPDGALYSFSRDGRMEKKESYSNGTPDGEWLQTSYDGAIASRKVYRQGDLVTEMTREDRGRSSSLF
ncbi:toxin-antitoxin system YwqK family antitoxin [Marinobacter bohaiensis]|uniref:toxin-antitoxin system YwqK family antitoxin n=1 Tax=Marinobacter bohaiensis TaxID=2201898 RepID=UPI000DAE54CA|nr:hypothetical protein [Marinobacter bohaiensis]